MPRPQPSKAGQRRYRQPKPPSIQILLQKAQQLKERLSKEPSLTRDALAKELGMAPSYLTRILNLLNLAPEIRQHILAMPPAVQLGSITETRLCPLARSPDWRYQLEEFRKLLFRPARIRKTRTTEAFSRNCNLSPRNIVSDKLKVRVAHRGIPMPVY